MAPVFSRRKPDRKLHCRILGMHPTVSAADREIGLKPCLVAKILGQMIGANHREKAKERRIALPQDDGPAPNDRQTRVPRRANGALELLGGGHRKDACEETAPSEMS